jgi:hypothetical protein
VVETIEARSPQHNSGVRLTCLCLIGATCPERSRRACPDRQLQSSSRFHTKTVLKDRRNAQTTHATFPEAQTGPPRFPVRGAWGIRRRPVSTEYRAPGRRPPAGQAGLVELGRSIEPRRLRPGRFCGTGGSADPGGGICTWKGASESDDRIKWGRPGRPARGAWGIRRHSALSGAEGRTSNRNIPLLEFLQRPENNADENF